MELKDLWERLTAVKEAQGLIRSTIKAMPLERTFTSTFSNTFCGCMSWWSARISHALLIHFFSLYYIDSPSTDLFPDPSVLSVRSIRHTPKPGHSKIPRFVLLNLRQILSKSLLELALEDEDEGIDAQTKDVW